MFHRVAIWLALWPLVAIYAAESPPTHGQSSLAAGIDAMHSGRLAQARIDLERAVQEHPDDAEANIQLGLLLGQLGDTQHASAAFLRTLQLNPSSPEAHYNLGLTRIADPYDKVDWRGAMAEFRKAIQLRPSYAEAHHALGQGLMEAGALDQAMIELRKAVSMKSLPENHLDLGKALAQAGQKEAALREYQEALRQRPGYADAEIAWAKLLATADGSSTGALRDAAEHFRRALKSDPDNLAAQHGLAQVLKRQGDTAHEANVELREAQDLTMRRQEKVRCIRLSNEGLDAARHGNRQLAVSKLREAVDLRPDVAVAHYNLGLLLADSGDLERGVAEVVEAISLASSEAHFYVSLGRMWQRQGKAGKARGAFQRACELDPGNLEARAELRQAGSVASPDPPTQDDDAFEYGAPADTPDQHFAFATILARRGDWIGSAGEWLRVLSLRPNDLDARNNLAVSYSHAGKADRAELEFQKALQVSADSPDAHFGLGVLALDRKENRAAIQQLKEVIRIKPAYPQAQTLLSLALTQSQ